MTEETGHIPVLLDPVLATLDPQPGDVVVDGTIGRGGHAAAIAQRMLHLAPETRPPPPGQIIGFDLDPENLAFARDRLERSPFALAGGGVELIHDSFVAAPRRLRERNITADVVLADLGFSSNQMDDPARGFSFLREGPLDMRLNPDQPASAADLLRTLPEAELADIIYRYGEEPLSRRIARKLVAERQIRPIDTTARLAELVVDAYGQRARSSRMHPATRTFMALRIAVNDELAALRALLDAVESAATRGGRDSWIAPGSRVGIISFHSLEDRAVKQAFVRLAQRGLAERLTRKPVMADPLEVEANPRARSAKFRAIRLTGGPETPPA